MDFKQKYFKYKNKYLKLRNQENNSNLEGGDSSSFQVVPPFDNKWFFLIDSDNKSDYNPLFLICDSWIKHSTLFTEEEKTQIDMYRNSSYFFTSKRYEDITRTTSFNSQINDEKNLELLNTKRNEYIKNYKNEGNKNYNDFINQIFTTGRIREYTNMNPLSYAMKLDKIDLAEKLIELGADINLALELLFKNININLDLSPKEKLDLLLKEEIEKNNYNLPKKLIELGADIKEVLKLLLNNRDIHLVLEEEINKKNYNFAILLIEFGGVNINFLFHNNNNLLHIIIQQIYDLEDLSPSIYKNIIKYVEFLISNQIDLDQVNYTGTTITEKTRGEIPYQMLERTIQKLDKKEQSLKLKKLYLLIKIKEIFDKNK